VVPISGYADYLFQLFNFVIAKITPLMLADITYGTFLLFGSCCILMFVYTVFMVPETKGIPLESINVLFEGNIIKGCIQDTIPRHSRANKLNAHQFIDEAGSEASVQPGHKGTATGVQHVESA
jgi:hypothetical protein